MSLHFNMFYIKILWLPVLLALVPGCRQFRHDHYYLYFEEAIDAYYRPPLDPALALSILKEACQYFPEERDLSCFNYGLLLQLERQPEQARKAYEAAYAIIPDREYREALRSLGGKIQYKNQGAQLLQELLDACQNGKTDQALSLAQKLKLSKNMLEQPPLQACLKEAAGYAELVHRSWPDSRNINALNYSYRAGHSQYHRLWDMRLILDKGARSTDHPVARAWQSYLQQRSGRALLEFYQALDQRAGDDPVEKKRALGFKRAAALLATRAGFGGAGVEAVAAPYLR